MLDLNWMASRNLPVEFDRQDRAHLSDKLLATGYPCTIKPDENRMRRLGTNPQPVEPHMHRHALAVAVVAMAIVSTSVLLADVALAEERIVSSPEELTSALNTAGPGDDIILNPGVYAGELSRANLQQLTIRSADPANPAVIEGGNYGLHLMDPVDVTLADLVFRGQLDNGINIDDAGSYETPARGIRLLRITVRDMVNAGNHDAIKMAGVRDFLIDGARVENWGNDGSAIDFVGCHHGLVQNSFLTHNALEVSGSGIRPKGGSKDIVIRANRIELPNNKGRAIQAGGSTDAEFFRFLDGDSGYEARDITVEGNVVIGGGAPFSYVNIDGGIFHHNVAHRPGQWVVRILNENPETDIVDTRNGRFHDNRVVFNDTGGEFDTAVNVGDETLAETFSFARNRWLNLANPTPDGSTPTLPAAETDGVYGEQPTADTGQPQVWDFPWGKWIVNASAAPMSVAIPDGANLQRAQPSGAAKFEPLLADPLTGSWSAGDVGAAAVDLPAMSQAILIDPAVCPDCAGGE